MKSLKPKEIIAWFEFLSYPNFALDSRQLFILVVSSFLNNLADPQLADVNSTTSHKTDGDEDSTNYLWKA